MRDSIIGSLFVALLLIAVPALCAADDDKRDAELRSVVERFLMCWEQNDIESFASLLHDEVEFAYPGDRLNKQELVAMFRDYQAKKQNIKIYLWEQFFVDGDRFALAYQFAATDRRSQKRQAVGTGVVGRMRDGKIVLFKEYYDEEVAGLQYAGKLPLDEGRVTPWPASVWLRPETVD